MGSNGSLSNCEPATPSVALAFSIDMFPTSHSDDCHVREGERETGAKWMGNQDPSPSTKNARGTKEWPVARCELRYWLTAG
jgi:hypothetical protein